MRPTNLTLSPALRLGPRSLWIWRVVLGALLGLTAPALAQSGSLVQWGRTNEGQQNNAPAASERFAAVAARRHHSLALRADGSLVQWGDTSQGQGNNAPAASERFVAIAAGGYHNLALRADGSLVQWGSTSQWQAANAPAASERFVAIDAGLYHNLALRADGSLVQWGSAFSGQASNAPAASERFVAVAAGDHHNLALRADGSLVQWGDTSQGQANNAPAASERFVSIAAGDAHSLALRADGSYVQWGATSSGQASNAPAASERFVAIAAGRHHSLALRADGSLVQWGSTSGGQGNNAPAASERFADIAGGGHHNLALRGSPVAGRLAFTYQGLLTGVPGGGAAADLRFSLWTGQSGGEQRGMALTLTSVPFSPRGLFSAELDFGFLDPSDSPWLQIEVAQPGSGSFTVLSPRQRLGGAPMAALAGSAVTAVAAQSVPWSGITGVPAGFADGVDNTGDSRWTDLPSGIAYTGPGGTTINGVRLIHGTQGGTWDLAVGGSSNSFAGGFAVAEQGAAKLVVQAATGHVGIGTTTPTEKLCVDPQGPGGIIIGGPDRTAGGRTSLTLGVTALSGGAATIESISTAGSSYGSLLLNPISGNVGIGTTTPTFKLDVAGNIRCTSLTQTSSARYKREVAPVLGVLERFLRLRPVSFTWDQGHGGDRAVGLIAEEVGEVFPECVSVVDGVAEGIDYAKLTTLAVQAIKEQQQLAAAENADVRGECAALRAENAELRRAVEELRAAVADLALEQGKQGRTSWNEQSKTGGAP